MYGYRLYGTGFYGGTQIQQQPSPPSLVISLIAPKLTDSLIAKQLQTLASSR